METRRPGRPKLAPEDTRTVRMALKLTQQEKQLLVDRARAQKISVARSVRQDALASARMPS